MLFTPATLATGGFQQSQEVQKPHHDRPHKYLQLSAAQGLTSVVWGDLWQSPCLLTEVLPMISYQLLHLFQICFNSFHLLLAEAAALTEKHTCDSQPSDVVTASKMNPTLPNKAVFLSKLHPINKVLNCDPEQASRKEWRHLETRWAKKNKKKKTNGHMVQIPSPKVTVIKMASVIALAPAISLQQS